MRFALLFRTVVVVVAGALFCVTVDAGAATAATSTTTATTTARPPSLPPPAPPPRWERVPPVDWTTIALDDFADDELDLPFFLHHFHTVANAVQEEGPHRGFMTIPVWRGQDQNQQMPHNARVMESHLTLAYFYCTDRPWNPYFGSPAVRDRLEAMLTFWCEMQHADGRFSEYEPRGWNLAATAFATKFMGQTLTLLARAKDAAPIDPALHRRVIDADRKAILAVLTRAEFYPFGTSYTNQYTNVFAGAAAYLALFPQEREIPPLLAQKFADAGRDFRSPCGYFYEANGPDFGYTLFTHHSNARMAYHYWRGTPLGDVLERQEATWNDWLGYNMLREPDGATFVFNRGIETRQDRVHWPRHDGPFARTVPSARAFATPREERAARVRQQREELARNWGQFPDLAVGKSSKNPFTPYDFLHRDHDIYYPTAAERDAALARLPYLASDRFIKQLTDPRTGATYTFVRRPSYYVAFNSGPRLTARQRLGLGIIWNPKHGTLLQTQSGSDDDAWGTRADGAKQVYEAGTVEATFSDDLASVTYPLGDGRGRKTVQFRDDAIEVRVEHLGGFVEQIPLLTIGDGEPPLRIEFSTGGKGGSGADSGAAMRSTGAQVLFGAKSLATRRLEARDHLTYTLRIAP